MEFGNKKVNEWFELYLKIANSKNSRDDFNPEGIYANSPARVTEQEKASAKSSSISIIIVLIIIFLHVILFIFSVDIF